MNISSIVIKVSTDKTEELVTRIKSCDYCDYHLHADGKIIVTIEGENLDEEIAKLKKIEAMPDVISASLAYAYFEEEMEGNRELCGSENIVPEWLNNDSLTAENIKYNGDLRRKI